MRNLPTLPTRRQALISGLAASLAGPSCAQVRQADFTPQAFGASPDTDATEALNKLFAAARAADAAVDFSQPLTLRTNHLRFPAGLRIVGSGVVLRAADAIERLWIDIEEGVAIERLNMSLSGRGGGYRIGRIGARCTIGALVLAADRQTELAGLLASGQDLTIGAFESQRVARPLHIAGAVKRPASGCRLGSIKVRDYVRALRLDYLDDFTIGSINFSGRSPQASKRPGHNGILIVGCQDGRFSECRINDAGEHAIRIGGANRKSADLSFGTIVTERAGGCAFKANPTKRRLASERITIASLTGIDGGDPLGGNSDLLRLSHVRDVTVGRLEGRTVSREYSCWTGVKLNDVRGLHVEAADIQDARRALFVIDESSDGDPAGVYDVRVNAFRGSTSDPRAAIGIEFTSPNYEIGDIHLNGIDFAGSSPAFCRSPDDVSVRLAGAVSLNGQIHSPMGSVITGLDVEDPRVSIELRKY